MSRSHPHVLIIGAGLGGLALAQSLRKKNISFTISERDESSSSRQQGWAITLDEEMIELFKTSFPDDMPSMAPLSHLHSLGLPMEFAVYAGVPKIGLKEILRRGPEYGQAGMMRVDRARLRRWLMTGLNPQWGKKFSHYREEDGGVVAVFEDGEEVKGDVLVGADGVASRVRKQLLPGIEPQRVLLRVAVGEVQVSRETYQRWFALGRSYFTVFDGERRITVALKGISEDGETADYYWIFGLQPQTGKKEEEETWNSREELHSFVMKNMEGIDERIQEILRATPAEGMLFPPLVIRDMLPPGEEAWPKGGRKVTLLGDAVHAMTPFRGQGGNTAMTDGISMASILSNVTEDAKLGDVLQAYEDEMRPRATKWVVASRDAVKKQEVGKWS